MNGLLPIIRRERRPLLPPDEPAAVVKSEPLAPPVSIPAPVMASEPSPAPVSPAVKPPRKRKDETKPKES